jgi:hypothetical protein
MFHRHRDPNWKLHNVHRYYLCRCGARRVCRAFANLDGPTLGPPWPPMVDHHGMPVFDTGWVKS